MTWDFPKTEEEAARDVQRLAAAVIRDMPGADPRAHLHEAMRRCKGSLNPSVVRCVLASLQSGKDSDE